MSWNKTQKQLKNMLLNKDLSPNKIKTVIFILNHIKNFIDPAKLMTLLVPKIF